MPADGFPTFLLQTKLYRPPITEDYFPRLRLQAQLEQIVRKPLTLVSAPAGYGKSTLLSAWVEQSEVSGAWLSLDKSDNDAISFAAYLVVAVGNLFPGFGKDILTKLSGPNPPRPRSFVQMFCAELDRLQQDIVLILDDYGIIDNGDVHALVSELLVHPHPCFHLTLLTRHDPPLPLNDWRARNQIVEIRSSELRFSLAETDAFLRRAVGRELDEATIAALNQKTEGWAAGLRLAALSFTRIEGFEDQIDVISGSNMYIMDYLFTQVLDRLPAETQSFLVQSSVLDRFTAPLCQAVIDSGFTVPAVQAMLQELDDANIFIISLDEIRGWYRYHNLFQQFLQMRLEHDYTSEDLKTLHRRASAWFAAHDFVEEALRHALSAGDMGIALELVAANRQELMNQERFQLLAHWLSLFPQHVIDESPDLLLLQARFTQMQRYDLVELSRIMGKVDALINNSDLELQHKQRLLGEYDALRSAQHYYGLDPQNALKCCQDALQVLPQEWYALRSFCWIYGAVALQMLGDLSEAYAWAGQGRDEDLLIEDGPQARNVAAEGFVSWMNGDLTRLQRVGEFILGVTSDSSRWQSQGWAHYFLACAHYHRHELDSAQRHAQETFNQRHVNHAAATIYSAFILALIQQAQGKPDDANEILALASDYAVEIRSSTFMHMVESFQVELAVMQGRAREVSQWAEQACAHLQLVAMPFFYAPSLTIPKVLLAAGTPQGLIQAAGCIQRLRDFAESTHNDRVLSEVLALEAMLHAARGDEQAAIAALEHSLSLAQPGGFIRLYVDLGPKIANLLHGMQNHGRYRAYVATILSAFPNGAAAGPQSDLPWQLIEPLTGREEEILDLLAKRYTNQEIAVQLFISPATVKRHTINIYQKLAVHSRRDAVEVARELGLIPLP